MSQLKPVSATAFCTCGIRMDDARHASPLCGDHYAKVFMDDRAIQHYKAFETERIASQNIAVRHRIIDERIEYHLKKDTGLRIISLGCGLETRCARLSGGKWIEVDEPAVIHYKNEKLPPDTVKNPLIRIPVDFSRDNLKEKLNDHATTDHVVIVVEGVFLYLSESQITATLKTLQFLFPDHTLITDLMSKSFAEKYSRSFDKKINQLGAHYQTMLQPVSIFRKHHYQIQYSQSIAALRAKLRKNWLLLGAMAWFLDTMREGYQVYEMGYHRNQ